MPKEAFAKVTGRDVLMDALKLTADDRTEQGRKDFHVLVTKALFDVIDGIRRFETLGKIIK